MNRKSDRSEPQTVRDPIASIAHGLGILPCALAATLCTLVSMYFNAAFAAKFGPELVLLGVASDLLKASAGPALKHHLWTKQYGSALVAILLLLVTVSLSITSGLGHVFTTRATQHETEQLARLHTSALRSEYQRLETELDTLKSSSSPLVLRAQLDANTVPMAIWARSNACTNISLEETKRACAEVIELRLELTQAERKEALLKTIADVQHKLAVAPTGLEAQSKGLAMIRGIDRDTIGLCVTILVVLVAELGSIAGWILVAGYQGPSAQGHCRTPVTMKTTQSSGRKRNEALMKFVAGFREKHGRNPKGSEVMQAYPGTPKSTAYNYAKVAIRI